MGYLSAGAITALAVASVGFHIYLIFVGLIPNLVSRPLHLALVLPWVFVIGDAATGWRKGIGWSLCAIGLACSFAIVFWRVPLEDQYGSLEG